MVRRLVTWALAANEPRFKSLHCLLELARADFSGSDQERVRGDMICLPEGKHLLAAEGSEGLLGSGEALSQRVTRPEGLVEQVMDIFVGLIQVHGQLFLDD